MRVRLIYHRELSALIELYGHLHKNDAPLPRGSRLEMMWQEIFDDPNMHYVVAEEDGELISSCVLVVVANMTRGGRPWGVIENVVTHGDYRGQGIGKAVLKRALEIAWRHDCYKVLLMSGKKDEGMMRFYESAGFVRGEKTGFIARPGG